MGLLAGQETTIKNGNKELYDVLWNKNMEIQSLFTYHTTELIAGKDQPYFRISNARKGFEISDYLSTRLMDTLGWKWNEYERIIPDWIQFKVKPNTYAKKNGYKPFVNLMTGDDHHYIFENGNTVKEFSNCIVVIKKYRTSINDRFMF